MPVYKSKVILESDKFTQNNDDMWMLVKERKNILVRAKNKSDEKMEAL